MGHSVMFIWILNNKVTCSIRLNARWKAKRIAKISKTKILLHKIGSLTVSIFVGYAMTQRAGRRA